MIDSRGIPSCTCVNCGCNFFKAVISFDPDTYEVGMYMLNVECFKCGALATAPTPEDLPERKAYE